MNNQLKAIIICIAAVFISQASFAADPKFQPVKDFNLSRFLGKWYEIARMPSSFEKELVNVTAEYSLKENGTVKVLNQGKNLSKGGAIEKAIGKAKFVGDPKVGHLLVSFFWIFYGDYIVVDLDPDYRWALVVSSPKLMWILAREPKIDDAVYARLVSEATKLGIDTTKLYRVPQEAAGK